LLWLGKHFQLILETVTALASVAVPVVVAVMAHRFNDQLKRWEANQWRNQELIRARLEYYRELAPPLNDLLCYFTFIGSWKEFTPPHVVALKRTIDRTFYSVSPLFSDNVRQEYEAFMRCCFETFGIWGEDARLRTGFRRRRDACREWDDAWDRQFVVPTGGQVPENDLVRIRDSYNSLMRALAQDVELSSPRDRYVTADLVLNAH
jgi:hypothetical protein